MSGKRESENIFSVLFRGWFRVLEVALIIGVVKYFADTTGNIFLKFTFWVSWFIFYQNIFSVLTEDVNYDVLPDKYKKFQRKFNVVAGSILGIAVVILMFIVVSVAVK